MSEIKFSPIGTIYTPFENIEGMPIQPSGAKGVKGTIEIHEKFIDGLLDIDGFSHIILIYHFHKVTDYKLLVKPFMDNNIHGIFATRSPIRPNAIGISVVKLCEITGNKILVEDVDILNNTPILDIKPFFEKFDNRFDTKQGWLEYTQDHNLLSDNRFK